MFQAHFFKLFYLFFCCTFLSANLKAQNILVNADFETLNNCVEYHQDCSPEAWFYIKPAITPLINNNAVPTPFNGKDLLIVPVEKGEDMFHRKIIIFKI